MRSLLDEQPWSTMPGTTHMSWGWFSVSWNSKRALTSTAPSRGATNRSFMILLTRVRR
jgi:hypothetical protein